MDNYQLAKTTTDFQTLKQLAFDDKDDYVRECILENPNCDDNLRMYIQGRKLMKTLSC